MHTVLRMRSSEVSLLKEPPPPPPQEEGRLLAVRHEEEAILDLPQLEPTELALWWCRVTMPPEEDTDLGLSLRPRFDDRPEWYVLCCAEGLLLLLLLLLLFMFCLSVLEPDLGRYINDDIVVVGVVDKVRVTLFVDDIA